MSNRVSQVLETGSVSSAPTGPTFYPQALRDQTGYFQLEVVTAPTSFTLSIQIQAEPGMSWVTILDIPSTNVSSLGVSFAGLNWAPASAGNATDGSGLFTVGIPMTPNMRLHFTAWSGTGEVNAWLVE